MASAPITTIATTNSRISSNVLLVRPIIITVLSTFALVSGTSFRCGKPDGAIFNRPDPTRERPYDGPEAHGYCNDQKLDHFAAPCFHCFGRVFAALPQRAHSSRQETPRATSASPFFPPVAMAAAALRSTVTMSKSPPSRLDECERRPFRSEADVPSIACLCAGAPAVPAPRNAIGQAGQFLALLNRAAE